MGEWVLHGDLFELLADYTVYSSDTHVTETINPLGKRISLRSYDEKTVKQKTRFQADDIIYTNFDHDGFFRRKKLIFIACNIVPKYFIPTFLTVKIRLTRNLTGKCIKIL